MSYIVEIRRVGRYYVLTPRQTAQPVISTDPNRPSIYPRDPYIGDRRARTYQGAKRKAHRWASKLRARESRWQERRSEPLAVVAD